MVSIEFEYQQTKTLIQANLSERFETILNKFKIKTNVNTDSLCYLANGSNIEKNDIIENIMNDNDKQNQMIKILVNDTNIIGDSKNDNLVKSKDIICPACKEVCKMEIKNYRIKLYDCKNGHVKENIKLDEFNNTQIIDISKIICDNCKINNKAESYKNKFFKCCECDMNLCSLCKSKHDNTHSILNYDDKDYKCNRHDKDFLKYCQSCKINLCFSCLEDHKEHKMIGYEEKIINIKKIRERMDELKNMINKFKENIEEIIMKFRKVVEYIEKFYNFDNDLYNILNYYEKNKDVNFQKLINLNSINDSINNEIKNIINTYSYGQNLNKLLYLYNNIYNENQEIEMKYIPKENNDDKVQIFGQDFINNNIFKCRIIYNNKEYELTKYFNDINTRYKNQDPFTFKLKGINNITDMSYMFDNCSSLSSLPNISNWNTSNVSNMSFMFNECISLLSLPDISNWNISKVNNMSHMFNNCKLLESFPDISKWDTSNLFYLSNIFDNCSHSSSFPDISKWDTSKVYDKEELNLIISKIKNKKPIREVAQEVLDGKWGNGDVRIERLKKAGYDYKIIQKEVNKILYN